VSLEQQGVKSPEKSQKELSMLKVSVFEKQINNIVDMAWDLTREELKNNDVYQLYLETENICGIELGIDAALVWADNFKFPTNVGLRDLEKLKSYQ